MKIAVYNSVTELTQNAAQNAIDYLKTQLARQETVSIILATGNSQLQFLELLVNDRELDWSRIILFHLDEYLGIEPQHPGSFNFYLKTKVADRIRVRNFYYIQGDARQPLAECSRYSNLLQQQEIDLCLLGIGDNGHIAFNEPSVADFNDPYLVKIVRLENATRQQQVNGGYFKDLADVPSYAYTLTIPAICRARQIFCLATGFHKAKIIKRMLEGEISPSCPASILRQQPQATLFVDRDAISSIERWEKNQRGTITEAIYLADNNNA
jgi:glucosamine-6-phosphate deaminase